MTFLYAAPFNIRLHLANLVLKTLSLAALASCFHWKPCFARVLVFRVVPGSKHVSTPNFLHLLMALAAGMVATNSALVASVVAMTSVLSPAMSSSSSPNPLTVWRYAVMAVLQTSVGFFPRTASEKSST